MIKTIKKLILFVCIFMLIFSCSCFKSDEDNRCSIVEEESWFHEVYVENNKIYYRTLLTLNNSDNSDVTVKIIGDLTDEYNSGRIKEKQLTAVTTENTEYFIVPANNTLTVDAIFIGTPKSDIYNKKALKRDRLLFPLTLEIINTDEVTIPQ